VIINVAAPPRPKIPRKVTTANEVLNTNACEIPGQPFAQLG